MGWFGEVFLSYGFLAYLAIVIALVSAFILKRTKVGLNLRAVGESPATADAAGINVTRYKYVSTCVGGAIAGLGGLYYIVDYAKVWSSNGFGDRGWLAIALVIFSLWNPAASILGSFLFGGLYIAYLYIPGLGRSTQALIKMLPYVVTIVVLISVSIRKKRENQPPAALGLSYFREEREETLEGEGDPFRRRSPSPSKPPSSLPNFPEPGLFYSALDFMWDLEFTECVALRGGKAPAQESFWMFGAV